MTVTRAVVLAMFPALLAWGGAARDAAAAGEPAPIHIDLETCPTNWDPEIRLALAVELGDERLATEEGEAGRAGAHRLSVRCAEHRVWVVAHDAKTAATLERTLNGDLPAATAPRTIALVAANLLTTFDPALRRRLEAPAPPRAPAAESTPPALPPAPESPRLSLTAGGVYRTFLADGGVDAWGGVIDGLRVSRDGRWSIGLGVEVSGGERSTSIGQTSALLASARVSGGMRIPLASDRFALDLDVGARGGIVRMSGNASVPNVDAFTVVAPWAGPVATLRAQVGVSSFCAEIAAEGGWAAVSKQGLVGSGTSLAIAGPWLAISLGLGSRR